MPGTTRLRVLQATMAQGALLGLAPLRAGVRLPLGYRRVLEQLLDDGANAFVDRRLQRQWVLARRRDPGLTPRQFVRQAAGRAQQLLRELLGPDQYVLEALAEGPAYFAAWQRVVDSWRHVPPPADCGHSFGHWDADLAGLGRPPEGMLLPMDYPVFDRDGRPSYPGWPTAKVRGQQLMAHVNLSRWLPDVDLPLAITPQELVELLGDQAAARVAHRSELHPDLIQTPTQLAFTRATGLAPIVAWQRIPSANSRLPGFRASAASGSRQAQEARFELAARLYAAGDPDFGQALDLDALRTNTGLGAGRNLPADPDNWSPFARLEIDELLGLARGNPGAPLIQLHVFELEHHIPERTPGRLEGLFRALEGQRPTAELSTRLRALCGFSDPANIHLVTPWEHARLDAYAAAWAGRENLQRIHDYANVRTRIPDPEDAVMAPHPDLPRVDSPFLGFELPQLLPVVELIRGRLTPAALARLAQSEQATLRELIPRINRLLGYYRRDDLRLDFPLLY
jgi:hypothetical protein